MVDAVHRAENECVVSDVSPGVKDVRAMHWSTYLLYPTNKKGAQAPCDLDRSAFFMTAEYREESIELWGPHASPVLRLTLNWAGMHGDDILKDLFFCSFLCK